MMCNIKTKKKNQHKKPLRYKEYSTLQQHLITEYFQYKFIVEILGNEKCNDDEQEHC